MGRTFRLIVTIFVILLFGCCIFFYQLTPDRSYHEETFTETTDELSNPYRGWFQIQGFLLSDDMEIPQIPCVGDDSQPELMLIEINLSNFSDGDITSRSLEKLDELFAAWNESGHQLIVRFLYDWGNNDGSAEPCDISIILNHMEQTADIVNRYASCIYTLQGIFVGHYGEMNGSSFLTENDITTLMHKLSSVTDPSIFLSVRTPAHLRTINVKKSPISSEAAFSQTEEARLGLFNDALLSGATDSGTYGDGVNNDSSSLIAKWSRAKEIAFQNDLCSYVPNGGETITDNRYNDPENAINGLQGIHVSYLNNQYDPAVLNKWKNAAYNGNDTIYAGMSVYDYISRHLGYRYVIRSTSCDFNNSGFGNASISVRLENTGFSACYRELEASLIIVSKRSREVIRIPFDADLRRLDSGGTLNLSVPVSIQTYDKGTYEFYLSIKDSTTGRDILLANNGYTEEYGYLLSTLKISKKAK